MSLGSGSLPDGTNSRRGGISIHSVFKKRRAEAHAGASPAAATILPPWLEQQTRRTQNPLPIMGVRVRLAPTAPIFSASGGMHTRESQKLVGEQPVQVQVLSRRPLWGSETGVTSSEKNES